MKPVSASLFLLLLSFFLLSSQVPGVAQTDAAAKPASRATIQGVVTKDPGGEPVKKAVIEVIGENQAESGDYTAVTGSDGRFHIDGVLPGRYHLFVERTGLLEVTRHQARSEGRVITVNAGQEVTDITIRVQAAAVVQGRVVDEDGDPLPNSQVNVLRQNFASGHSRWQQVGGERTNDLGEYRVANLPAGNYYVSVSPPPDFKSLIEASGAVKPESKPSGADKPATSYQTTYYPGTTDRSQAIPIQLHPGDDFPVNFSLTAVPSLSIRGSVVGLPPHASASILLQSRDFDFTLNGAEVQKDGSFAIHDVSPGAYTVLATVDNAPAPMTARQALQVTNSVDGLRLAPQSGAWIHGRMRLETSGSAKLNPGQMTLYLRSADRDDDLSGKFFIGDGFNNLAIVGADGSFEWKGVPAGNYSVQLTAERVAGSEDLYLKSSSTSGREAGDSGLSVNGGTLMVDLVASPNGAVVEGMAVNQNNAPVTNAVIVAVPDARFRGREDRFSKTVTDQRGRFTLHAIPPGDYTLFAWESVDGESYYNPEFLKTYDGQGIALRIGESEHKNVQLKVISDSASDGGSEQ
jgi:hypothetical protein